MTHEQVIAKRKELQEEYLILEGEMDIIKAKMNSLKKFCKHPNLKSGHDYDGGSSSYCADCGYQT